jgi:hypothetical protein
VKINPSVWANYKSMAGMDQLPGQLYRADLANVRRELDLSSAAAVRRLFVLTMMWGSGTSNGRGPRNTHAALEGPDVDDVLRRSIELVAAGEIGEAYDLHKKLRQVGPSFHTKWLWVIGSSAESRLRPLILDKLVWTALGTLGWDSRSAAGGNRRWSARYVAYLEACAEWASDVGCTPEDIEYSLFRRGRSG